MSIIDRALRGSPVDAPPLKVPEAIAAVLIAAITADGVVSPEEAVRINGAKNRG